MPRPESDRVRVFISYAHASPQHKADVETLAVLLDAGGVEVILDIWQDALRRHWPTWARESIDTCDFVLAVASSVYKGAAEGSWETTSTGGPSPRPCFSRRGSRKSGRGGG